MPWWGGHATLARRAIGSIPATPRARAWNHLLVDENDPERRISELERRLSESQGVEPAPMPQPQSGWPQAAQPQPGFSPQPQGYPGFGQGPQGYPGFGQGPQPFPPPPSVGPTGDQFGSWPSSFPSPSPGWQGAPQFGRRPWRRARYLVWILVVLLLVLWPIVKHPFLGLVERTVDHESTAGQSTAQHPATSALGTPAACKLFTIDLAKPVLGPDAHVTQNTSGICTYTSSQGFGSVEISDWPSTKPSGPDLRPVQGLGDEAVFSNNELYVKKGPAGLKILLSDGPFSPGTSDDFDAKRDDAEKAIAQQMLAKL